MASENPSSTLSVTTEASSPSPSILHFNVALSIPLKLTSSNYPLWRAQVRSVLIGHNLLRFVDGSHACPSVSDGDAHTLWVRQDQLLLNIILATVSEQLLPFIASSSTSAQAWKTLEILYAGKSRTRVMQLKSQLAAIRKDSLSVLDYLQRIQSLCDELAVIDRPVLEDDQVIYALNGLGSGYREFTTSIKTRESAITVAELHARLVEFEDDLGRMTHTSSVT